MFTGAVVVAFVSWSGVPSVSISGVAGGAGEGFAFCSGGELNR